MAKQTCGWCGRDRKAKHFSNGSGDCNDCANQQANQTLAGSHGSGAGIGAPTGMPPHLAAMFSQISQNTSSAGVPLQFVPGGGQVGGPGVQRPKRRRKREYTVHQNGQELPIATLARPLDLENAQAAAEEYAQAELDWDERGTTGTAPDGTTYIISPRQGARSVEEVSTFVESGLVKQIELQLEYGMNDQGMPLSDTERAELQKQYAKLTFQSEDEVDEDEEAEALKSILGVTDAP